MDILMSVSSNSRERDSNMKEFYQYYTAIAPESKIKVNKIHHFVEIDITVKLMNDDQLTEDFKVYFLTKDEYENWCKGRSYIYHGVPYHSGYPIKKEVKE